MKSDLYSLENLVKKFFEDAICSKKINKELIDKFIKEYPNEPLPDHFTNEFCLPFALSAICEEVLKLQKSGKLMEIDLSEWNEYIADDVPPGKIPEGKNLETMQIVTADAYIDKQKDDFPPGLKADPKSIKIRIFWRLKR